MKFNFFTFGGAVFWEDVFFYQKWRIQRHCMTKEYRLLDSWDIRRASGTFETCQRAFIKYIDCYEITKQKGRLIVLLHGYMDSKNIFKKFWRKLVNTNTTVAALNYPSLFRTSFASAHQLLFFLNHMEDIKEVSFVTKGGGNMVLQHMLNLPLESQNFREKMRIGNTVEINPVYKGSLLCELLGRFKFFRFLLGPMIKDFTDEGLEKLPELPRDIHVLKIFSDSAGYRLYLGILKFLHIPFDEDVYPKKNSIYIRSATFKALDNDEVLNNTVKFLSNGKI